MYPSYFVGVNMMIVMLMVIAANISRNRAIARRIQNKRRRQIKNGIKWESGMIELIKKYIGKECLIYTAGAQFTGVIKESADNAILIETKNGLEVLNLDYVVRVREYIKSKKGNRKTGAID